MQKYITSVEVPENDAVLMTHPQAKIATTSEDGQHKHQTYPFFLLSSDVNHDENIATHFKKIMNYRVES